MSDEAVGQIAPYFDATNIDLKASDDTSYKEVCGARLKPVHKAVRQMRELRVWVDITTLILPGLNDGERKLRDIAHFVKSIGPEVPWHVSQFYPAYELLDRPPTPVATLRRARKIGMEEGLGYPYEGTDCFARGKDYCDRLDCAWRQYCLEKAQNATTGYKHERAVVHDYESGV